jgi:S-adenosylmethionine:tRNA ribosyltransferase-isomerase
MSFDILHYELPPHLIAQEPCTPRDASRLLVVRRGDGSLAHHRFRDLPELLSPGDLLVLNDTRVVPARLLGRRARTGGKWEGLFLRQAPDGLWEMLTKSGGRLLAGEEIEVEPGPLRLTLVEKTELGRWLARPSEPGPALALLQRYGQVPLPPYIHKGLAAPEDSERYQTVYACQPGAVAAPTAGLHFTPTVFEALEKRGIERTFITLHVGPGTFQPVKVDDVTKHAMHSEWGEISEGAATAMTACRARGGRIVVVGTTSVRLLETVAASGPLRPWAGETNLFIYPPYPFRAVDVLLTNFHLPRSTLLLLAAAFAGADLLRRAYRTAIAESYRFYSYGDAMLIL